MSVERAFQRAPPSTDVAPADAVCFVCLDGADDEAASGGVLVRSCACRGPSAGFAHVACLAEMATRDEWIQLDDGEELNRWAYCSTCHQPFMGSLALDLCRRRWRLLRDADVSWLEGKGRAHANLATVLSLYDEGDAAEELHEMSRRALAIEVPGSASHIKCELDRVDVLINSAREREALATMKQLKPKIDKCADRSVRDALRKQYAGAMTAACAKIGRFDDALRYAAETGELARKCKGAESAEALRAWRVHAQMLTRLGRVKEAKASVDKLLVTQTRVLGADHPETYDTSRFHGMLAEVLPANDGSAGDGP
mmetsp:Transcript_3064/g.11688  ORF Transcript_3064/g.11688 Transcript_3064/m.11688 type:complete len:312 (-) Transcript_3064:1343-2278(-)